MFRPAKQKTNYVAWYLKSRTPNSLLHVWGQSWKKERGRERKGQRKDVLPAFVSCVLLTEAGFQEMSPSQARLLTSWGSVFSHQVLHWSRSSFKLWFIIAEHLIQMYTYVHHENIQIEVKSWCCITSDRWHLYLSAQQHLNITRLNIKDCKNAFFSGVRCR